MRLLLLLGLLLAASATRAQETPRGCVLEREGTTACFGEKLCLCRFVPGGQLSVRPAGHHWDCGALRPGCGIAPAGPPPVMPDYLPYLPQRRFSR
ncbi:hypothetical protein GCM10011504_27640 [Siccirubricoccus deserti]|uniref:Uncharacterized protein n=1 Tax=Siccirubricoccus deserti TaxID=2013562 RepID=A0A9X0UDZ6_9PROT|nr:hypothetical protein [Siccirubricoccus deserti]MBC4016168.1 hypothetical protein [Siccirubricoccus deserti]GGC47687.1 hypothetical protein GCM10011504_27640 [Siccirubricoccus deserti]